VESERGGLVECECGALVESHGLGK
jgi:hypothetical protein